MTKKHGYANRKILQELYHKIRNSESFYILEPMEWELLRIASGWLKDEAFLKDTKALAFGMRNYLTRSIRLGGDDLSKAAFLLGEALREDGLVDYLNDINELTEHEKETYQMLKWEVL